jgi:LPXTG-motif cell wall-anchored protein
VVIGAMVAIGTIGGHGVAEAYPPRPTGELPSGPVDNTPTAALPSGTLPQTGGPGTTEILALAAAAVAGGLVVTGVAGRSRRRHDAVA